MPREKNAHGVLFRGGEEGEIRKNLIEKSSSKFECTKIIFYKILVFFLYAFLKFFKISFS